MRELREREYSICIGGLRNPNRAVAKSAGLQAIGSRHNGVLEKFALEHPSVLDLFNDIGNEDATGFKCYDIFALGRELAECLWHQGSVRLGASIVLTCTFQSSHGRCT